MTFFITGHTQGIGEALHKEFGGRGFSRSNGYDLTKEKDRHRMYDQLEDCTVFINNAFPIVEKELADQMWTQVQILYDVYDRVSNDCIIMSIGSNTVDDQKRKVWPYQAAKAALDKAVEQLSYIHTGPRICSIKLGYTGTKRILNDYNPPKYNDLSEVVDAAFYVIEAAKRDTLINGMYLRKYGYG